jgi:uncharacterized protein (DUF305 family)
MKRTLRTLALPVALAAVLATTACGSSAPDSHALDGTDRPSASSGAGSPGTTTGDHNGADVAFATGMIPHHAQAVAMADLALDRATTEPVRSLATRIKAAQDPEIRTMSGWLTAWGEPAPHVDAASGAHAPSGHGGMMTDGEMAALGTAAGPAFDRMWLALMVRHHEGAVAMARTALQTGRHPDARQLARAIIDGQTKEISTMKRLLAATGG